MELIPYIQKNYRTENFKIAVGHGKTANFINYYLLKGAPLFQSYVVLSPDLATNMPKFLTERLPNIQQKTFYYMATSNNDVKRIKTETKELIKSLEAVDNKNVLKTFDVFDGPSHYSLPAHAIPKALESIFLVFQPISKKLARKEYPDTLLGNYYLGRFYEETGEPKKAMKTYQSAYVLEEIAGITKDQVLEMAEQIKVDFGY